MYRAYLVVMLAITAAAPAVRLLLLWLAEALPEFTVLPATTLLTVLLKALLTVLLIASCLVAAGWYLMPLRVSLPELDLLFTSGLSRWRMLFGRAARWCIGLACGGVALSALVLGAMALRGDFHWDAVAPALTIGAATGFLAAALLGLGQRLRGSRWESMREQASQLDAVSALAVSGEFRGAAQRLGTPVTFGRHLGLAAGWGGAGPAGTRLILSRDVLGVLRTPARSLAALLCVTAAGVLSGLAASHAPWALVLALPLVYASIGPWGRGLSTAGQSVGASALLPFAPVGVLARHLVVPAFLSIAVCAASAWGAAALADRLFSGVGLDGNGFGVTGLDGATGLVVAIAVGAITGLFAVALRLLGALKGPLPQRLLAPIPTPVGDIASVNVLVWNLDGPILALAIGALFALILTSAPAYLPVALIAVLGLLLAWCRARVRSKLT